MTPVFSPSGPSGVLEYADDSTEASAEFAGATALLVFNPDASNVVVVSVGFSDGDVDAIVPTNGFNGSGVVVGPRQQLIIGMPQKQTATGNLFVSVAGLSITGSVYITPGTV